MIKSTYEKFPTLKVPDFSNNCYINWSEIIKKIKIDIDINKNKKTIVVIDCYHGVIEEDIKINLINHLDTKNVFNTNHFFKPEVEIKELIQPFLTEDRVFGKINNLTLKDYLDNNKINNLHQKINQIDNGIIVIYGIGASKLVDNKTILIYADMPRWEIQLRMRKNLINNIGVNNKEIDFALKYKQGFFIDWRICDKHKMEIYNKIDYCLDTTQLSLPKMIIQKAINKALKNIVNQPFRLVPFFDPGPWGGQWMKEICDLDRNQKNYAWCFDCVPEENSLLFDFEKTIIEIPAINLVFLYPNELLGPKIYQTFGAEFPIRFDFLDTIEGGNLSLQVHPTKEYIKEHFGMPYTQDESYYILDAKEDAIVYLGLKENIDSTKMIEALKESNNTNKEFHANEFVETWKVKKHDHILIPAGTIHCSGKNSMVLEISATPYIFTFKLWDWNRLGLDGKPRPIHINHGEKVINWQRTASWTKKNLVNNIVNIAQGEGWREEKTGLHELEFIETRRHWFTKKVFHNTNNTLNVLNLVEGECIIVESPNNNFLPFKVNYAETFVIPASVGEYSIKPYGNSINKECATIKAYVR